MTTHIRSLKHGLASLIELQPEAKLPTIMSAFFTGLPSRNSVSPIVSQLANCNFSVIQPQYFGTYDSTGKLSPEGCVQSVFITQRIVSSGTIEDLQTQSLVDIPTSLDVVIGHCAGTCFAFDAVLRGLDVKLLVLLAPMLDFGIHCGEAGISVDFDSYVRYLASAFPRTHRMDQRIWRNFFLYDNSIHPTPNHCSPRPTYVKTLAVVGENDPTLDIEKCKLYTHKILEKYREFVYLVDFIVLPDIDHSEKTMLSATLAQRILNIARQ